SVFVIGHIIIDIKEITLIWLFFFFKQKTAYEITRRDWSSDVCSSDLVRRHRDWMLRAGTTTWEAKSGYGLDRDTELAQLRAIRAEGGVATWLGAHAVPPEHPDADAYLDFALAEVLPDARHLAEAADVFLERGAFDAAQARRYLLACRDAGLALRLHGDQFTESGAIPLAVELAARSVDHLEAT